MIDTEAVLTMTERGLRPASGIVVLDKPRGPSSHQVTAWVSSMLDLPAGHSGTLDPMVSGVLVIMLGKSVRLAPVLLKHEKEYIALMRLHGDASPEAIERVAGEFVGRIYQKPPRRSAVKRALRIRSIYGLEILDIDGRLVLFRVKCESGTYIRSLCYHMGLALGVGAQLQELRRIRSGPFGEEEACTLHDLKDSVVASEGGDASALLNLVHPMERAVIGIPQVIIQDMAVDAVCHGAVLAGVGVVSASPYNKGELVAILTQQRELVAIGEALIPSNAYRPGDTGLVIAPRSVLMDPGTYPKGWKKRT